LRRLRSVVDAGSMNSSFAQIKTATNDLDNYKHLLHSDMLLSLKDAGSVDVVGELLDAIEDHIEDAKARLEQRELESLRRIAK